MEKDTREKRRQDFPRPLFPWIFPRIAFLACLALAAFALAVVLTPVRPQGPAEPPFSERARSAALAATLRLRTAGQQLAQAAPGPGPGPGTDRPDLPLTVTLLTTQARALLAPQDAPGRGSAAPSPGPSSPALLPASTAALAAALAESGSQRLADAAVADGGMARLLAAVGTAQLLQASSLTAGAGGPAPDGGPGHTPAIAAATADATATATPTPTAAAAAQPSAACAVTQVTPPSGGLGASAATPETLAGAALAAAVRIEAQAVYGYQVALPRLEGDAAQSAAGHLARHEAALGGAEALGRKHCLPVPPREAGYTLEESFLAAPAAGLAGLELATLPVYGDLVALGTEEMRRWAVTGLLEAGRRSVRWGVDPGPLPGLAADPADFPALPAESPAAR